MDANFANGRLGLWAWAAASFLDREFCESGEFFLGCSFILEPPSVAEAMAGQAECAEITEGIWRVIRDWDFGFLWVFRYLGLSSFLGV